MLDWIYEPHSRRADKFVKGCLLRQRVLPLNGQTVPEGSPLHVI